KIRRPRPLKKGEADSPLRIIHVAPSWAGVTQRLELGLKADPTLRPVADLFLSGAGCEFPMYQREIKKVASMLSQEE
ncbi:MAG: hypothetical protein NWR72_10560, partial [Bacteroidia bacterium]|nr:hypothetical protein [Bacteroidia bacterium]